MGRVFAHVGVSADGVHHHDDRATAVFGAASSGARFAGTDRDGASLRMALRSAPGLPCAGVKLHTPGRVTIVTSDDGGRTYRFTVDRPAPERRPS